MADATQAAAPATPKDQKPKESPQTRLARRRIENDLEEAKIKHREAKLALATATTDLQVARATFLGNPATGILDNATDGFTKAFFTEAVLQFDLNLAKTDADAKLAALEA